MIYFLKFCAGWILPPGIFILALLVLSIYVWKNNFSRIIRIGLTTLTVVCYVFCLPLVAEKSLSWLESTYEPPQELYGDVIIMLGGGAFPDTIDINGKGTLCDAPANRLLTAVRLQKKLDIPILVSGGKVYDDTGVEAEIAKRILMDLGVPKNKILVENKSLNTTQNAKYSAEILREYNFSQPILVTSAFHMKRSVLNFTKNNITVLPYPSGYLTGKEHTFHYVKLRPSGDAVGNNATVLQEVIRTLITKYLE